MNDSNQLDNYKKTIFIVSTEFHLLNIFFTNHVKILSEFGTVWVFCDVDHAVFYDVFGDYENIKRIKLNIGRKISILNDIC